MMVTKERNSGIYVIDSGIMELNKIVDALPTYFNAKIDRRIKHDSWIWVNPQYQYEAREYIVNILKIRCVPIATSEEWYHFK